MGRPVFEKDVRAATVAPILFGLALLVSSKALGWPDRESIFEAFDAAELGSDD